MRKFTWEKIVHPATQSTRLKSHFNIPRLLYLMVFLGVVMVTFFHNLCTLKLKGTAWIPFLVAVALFVLADWAYRKKKSIRELLLKFLYPLILAITVIILGTVGFRNALDEPLTADHFYQAANLISLSSSDFSKIEQESNICMNIGQSLIVARFLGTFLAGYAFLLAFSLAVGKENISRLNFWFYRKVTHLFGLNKDYYVVIGDGEKAQSLASDLIRCHHHFVFLDGSDNEEIKEFLKDAGCWYLRGKPWSKANLSKLYIDKAKEVFVLCEADEDNFRTIQEMDDICVKNPHSPTEWFVHFNDMGFRDSIHKLLPRRSPQLNTFCVEAIAAGKILKHYPVYRRYDKEFTKFHAAVVGFNKQGQELLFELCQTSHFKKSQTTYIHIYYSQEEEDTVKAFLRKYPIFDQRNQYQAIFGRDERDIVNYTFSNIRIKFIPQIESEVGLRNQHFSLYTYFTPQTCNSLYVCIDKGMRNTEFLKIALPILFYQKTKEQRDIQVFCYYNYPDKEEQEYIETKLNALAPNIQVICFGNMLDECGLKSIENKDDLDLAKRIALIYHILYTNFKVQDVTATEGIKQIKEEIDQLRKAYTDKSIVIKHYEDRLESHLKTFLSLIYDLPDYTSLADQNWQSVTEIDRLSNIRAANHAQIKHLLYKRYSREEKSAHWKSDNLHELGEIEHRRWNAEKLLTGWRPYLDNKAWKEHKNSLRAQKYHNFLVTYEHLPPMEQSKDWVQVMGVVEADPQLQT